jgi:hypothetical protein
MAKLKPEIERLCQQHGFKYFVEENEGRILVKFGEGPGQLSQGEAQSIWGNRYDSSNIPSRPAPSQSQGYYAQPQPSYQRPPQEQFQQEVAQGNNANINVGEVVIQAAPVIIKKLGSCCTIL